MFNSNYNTSTQVSIPVQRSFFGFDKFIGDTRQKMEHLYRNHPEVFNSEKELMLKYWQFYEQLEVVFGDKFEAFRSWFIRCTSAETLTRCHRSLKEDGTIQLSPEKQEQQQEREQEWRSFWGNGVRHRGEQ